jgi:Arc/MetJ family transcription regulator
MSSTKTRFSIALDRETLAKAMRLSRSRTKRETIARALDELVRAERRRALAQALGSGVFETSEKALLRRRRRSHARR